MHSLKVRQVADHDLKLGLRGCRALQVLHNTGSSSSSSSSSNETGSREASFTQVVDSAEKQQLQLQQGQDAILTEQSCTQ
jgi:hypothetical protein